jgi:putative oxygen-independent coproporphyrinogen III oxidase
MHKVGLYIHFPWCKKKCPYCDFNSHPINSVMDQQKYIDALLFDLAVMMDKYPRKITTIFMGGGTPSLFSSAHMQQLIASIKNNYATDADIEITCEANPGAIDEEQFAGYFTAGINRLSIGVQSFTDTSLKAIGRIHNADNAHCAIDRAHAAGFKRINIDIMYALPQQSIAQAMQDLTEACLSKATHISWYQLTLEPDTYFARFPPKRLNEDMIAEMEQAGLQLLQQNNLNRYEISAYHKADDLPCRHNLNYWLFGDYHAIGAGAHGKITQDKQVIRYHKSRIPKHYLDAPQLATETIITQDELLLEFMLNALRLFRPITFDLAAAKTNITAKQIQQKLQPLVDLNLLYISDKSFQPTTLGYLHLNEVIGHFL